MGEGGCQKLGLAEKKGGGGGDSSFRLLDFTSQPSPSPFPGVESRRYSKKQARKREMGTLVNGHAWIRNDENFGFQTKSFLFE